MREGRRRCALGRCGKVPQTRPNPRWRGYNGPDVSTGDRWRDIPAGNKCGDGTDGLVNQRPGSGDFLATVATGLGLSC